MEQPIAILWDWDNTLVDGWPALTTAINAALAAHALPSWTETQARERMRRSLNESFPGLFGVAWPDARRIFLETFATVHLDQVRPMQDAAAALTAATCPQGVVSNKLGAYLRLEVEKLGWAGHFRSVIGAGDAAADKPDPAPIRHALGAIGLQPGPDIWYVGDTGLDMQAARAAGCTAVLVGSAEHDGGLAALDERGTAPHLHYADLAALAARLRAFAAN